MAVLSRGCECPYCEENLDNDFYFERLLGRTPRNAMKRPARKKPEEIKNLVVISDTHCGCQMGLCPDDPQQMDGGGEYKSSALQKKVWSMWREFWDEWVPSVTHGEPFAVVHNGDAVDGVHHGSTTQISHNLKDQGEIAYNCLREVVSRCQGRYYHIRGTEAHVGKSGQEEERLAKALGAVPDDNGNYARWEMWARVGRGLVHLTHHIGTTGRTHYESSAVMGEIGEAFVESGRWGDEFPDIIVRSHRHRNIKIEIPTKKGVTIGIVTPAWQIKTPYVYKIPGGRQSQPQLGGIVIRCGDEDVFTRAKVWNLERTPEVKL